jgi:hypothetical protein
MVSFIQRDSFAVLLTNDRKMGSWTAVLEKPSHSHSNAAPSSASNLERNSTGTTAKSPAVVWCARTLLALVPFLH